MTDHDSNGEESLPLSFEEEIDRSEPGIYDVTADPHTGMLEATFVVPGLPPEIEEFTSELHTENFDVWGVDSFELDPDWTTVTVGRPGQELDLTSELIDELQSRARELYENELPAKLFDEWTVYHVAASVEGVAIDAQLYADDLEDVLEADEYGIGYDDIDADESSRAGAGAGAGGLTTEALLRELESRIHRASREVR